MDEDLFEYFLAGGIVNTVSTGLRLLGTDDAKRLFEILSDPAVSSPIRLFRQPFTMPQAEEWCARAEASAAAKSELLLAAVRKADAVIAGNAGIHLIQDENMAEIGYWVAREYWGQGLAREMTASVIALARSRLDLKGLCATTAASNDASRHILEKFAFKATEEYELITAAGQSRPTVKYELHF